MMMSPVVLFSLLGVAQAGGGSCITMYTCTLSSENDGNPFPVEHCSSECEGNPVGDFDSKECINRHPFSLSRFVAVDAIAMVIWFIGAGFAMAAGVGGGGIFVPLGILLLKFATKPATGLSQASIFGASMAGLIINTQNRHPKADRPVIDYEMALFLAPMEMAGAKLGIIIQEILPDWAVITLMVTVLGATAFKTFKKAASTKKKELELLSSKGSDPEEAKKELAAGPANNSDDAATTRESTAAPNPNEISPAVMVSPNDISIYTDMPAESEGVLVESMQGEEYATAESGNGGAESTSPAEVVTMEEAQKPFSEQEETGLERRHSCEKWLEKDSKRPTKKLLYLALVWIVTIIITLFKGGKGMKSPIGVEQCKEGGGAMGHWSYWIFIMLEFVWLFSFACFRMFKLIDKTERKQAVNFPFLEEDVMWTHPNALYYGRWTFVAGIIAGLIGIGGGMVLGPLMLQMGILPQVSTATTATMVAMTSSYAALGYVTGNLVPWSYALLFFCTAFCGAFIGKSKIDKIVKREKKTYILIYILAGIITFAVIFVTIAGIVRYADKGCIDSFEMPCSGS